MTLAMFSRFPGDDRCRGPPIPIPENEQGVIAARRERANRAVRLDIGGAVGQVWRLYR